MWLLAQAPPDPENTLTSALTLMVVGMLVVFMSLVVIGELTGLLARLLRERPELAEVTPEPVREAEGFPTPAAPADGVNDPKILAILAAAAAVVVGQEASIRIRRVTRVLHPTASGSGWIEAGRVDLQGSHNVRR